MGEVSTADWTREWQTAQLIGEVTNVPQLDKPICIYMHMTTIIFYSFKTSTV